MAAGKTETWDRIGDPRRSASANHLPENGKGADLAATTRRVTGVLLPGEIVPDRSGLG